MFFRRKKKTEPLTWEQSLDIFIATFYNFTGNGKDKINFHDMWEDYKQSPFDEIDNLNLLINLFLNRCPEIKREGTTIIGLAKK